jgi:diguanylate cyclase (GGDEF)-like protein
LTRAATAAGVRACGCLPLPVRRPRMYVYRQMARRDDETLGCLVVWSSNEVELPSGYLGVLERVAGLAHVALEHRVERQRLRRLVDYDQVTGALSRAGMRSMIGGLETTARVHMLFDLDDFKVINDRYGHAAGDKILRQAVERIMSVLRYQDLLVRLGGDEFLILLAGGDVESGIAVSGRIMAALEEPIAVGTGRITVHTSIGIAPFDRSVSFDELTDRADRAMYAAKQKGKNRWETWSPSLVDAYSLEGASVNGGRLSASK